MSVDLSMTITAAVPRPDFTLAQRVEIHRAGRRRSGRRDQRHRRAAGDDRQQIVPAAAHAAGMLLDQLAERDAHLLFDVARLVHVAGDAEQLGAGVVRAADAGEPRRAAAQDGRRDGDRFDVVDRRRAAIEADIGRERRLQARLALLAFEAFEQRRFLAADIGAGAVVDDRCRSPSRGRCSCRSAGLIGLVDRRLQALALADELAADIDVGGVRAHGEAGDQAALDQHGADRGA